MNTISTIQKPGPGLQAAGNKAVRRTLPAMLGALVDRLEDMAEKRRSRRALLWLSDAQLKDIGLSRADAFKEARRSYFL